MHKKAHQLIYTQRSIWINMQMPVFDSTFNYVAIKQADRCFKMVLNSYQQLIRGSHTECYSNRTKQKVPPITPSKWC